MKIVFLCNEYPPFDKVGGIGVFTHTIAHGMTVKGHQVTILGYGKNSGERDDGGVRVVILSESTIKGVAWFVNRRRLYCWLKEHFFAGEIDVVEVPDYQGLLPFKFSWCPVIVRLHLHSSGIQATRIIRFLERRNLELHHNWIAVSKWIEQETKLYFNVAPLKSSVIYNPVIISDQYGDISFEVPSEYVLYVGTLSNRKGAFVLAEAGRSFLGSNPNLHLIYVGDITVENGQRADDKICKILGTSLSERVHFTGSIAHNMVLACMKKAQVFAFPSKLEAFGLVPAEAMACGVPVVYSTLHAGPEVIEDGVTGLLADPYNSNDVAEKVIRILNDKALAARLAENAKHSVKERFSLQRCVDETIKFYETSFAERK